jgi:hypothetical protein
MVIMERRSQEKQAKWELLREDAKCEVAVEERRASTHEKSFMAALIVE